MGDTIKDKAEENEQNNEKNTNNNAMKVVPTPVTLGNFLLSVLVVIIIATGSLVYYMIRKERQDYEQYNNLSQVVDGEDNNVAENNEVSTK